MKKEWDDSLKQNGMSPVQYLEKIGVLGPDVVAAHCIFVDEADRKTLAQRQVGCVHNPSSNMMIASGVSPVPEMRAAGIAVGLGTDGPAGSNNDLDLMEEIDLAAKLAKITKMDPLAMNAKAAVEMATIDGARALHLEKEIGSLEKGKKADLILISLDEPNAVPMYDVYAQLAYALKASDAGCGRDAHTTAAGTAALRWNHLRHSRRRRRVAAPLRADYAVNHYHPNAGKIAFVKAVE
jgi:5-methylthioadenosine/S-adenosylhomocysteine deaminase